MAKIVKKLKMVLLLSHSVMNHMNYVDLNDRIFSIHIFKVLLYRETVVGY